MMASQPSPLAYCQSMKSTATRMPVPRRLCPPSMALTWPFSVGQKNRKQRDELLSSLLSGRKEEDVNAQIDCLCKREAGKSFKAASLGRGPWVVVYTRGPPQLWKASQSVATLLSGKNRASQEFDPKTKSATNRADFGSPDLYVTASGTFELLGDASKLPVQAQANIERGCLHIFGKEIPLPIKGKGLFTVLYVDDKLRIFRSGASYALQVQEDELDKYLQA